MEQVKIVRHVKKFTLEQGCAYHWFDANGQNLLYSEGFMVETPYVEADGHMTRMPEEFEYMTVTIFEEDETREWRVLEGEQVGV
ncbi:MAG: hypothetical protein E6R03_12635 [Hyphomicrobiaceae bacterium]|nr:MAG: hypothetical protein E6R03_12635 [Hyphomicrobiaceae bacterium]